MSSRTNQETAARGVVPLLIAVVLAASLMPSEGQAQAPRAWQPRTSVTAAAYLVDVSYAGSGSPNFRYDFAGPAFGVVVAQPGLRAGAAFGPERTGVPDTVQTRYREFFLQTYGRLPLLPRDGDARTRVFVPLGLSAALRRLGRETSGPANSAADLEVTTVGLSGGLGVATQLNKGATAQLRAAPLVGIATQSIGSATGLTYGADVAAEVTFGPVSGRFGINAGYDLRYVGWRLGTAFRPEGTPRNVFSYTTLQHGLRVGIAF